jgi:putative endonuclease
MVRCIDGTLYSGFTTDLNRRLAAHNDGTGSKYTRSRRPVTLVYYEVFLTKSAALRRETAFKRMTRIQKEMLIFKNSKEYLFFMC